MSTTIDDIEPPDPRATLVAGGFTGIVCPGECGCLLDDPMPCGASSWNRDAETGIPHGCQPGHAHHDPRNPVFWIVSTKKEPPTAAAFDMWAHLA